MTNLIKRVTPSLPLRDTLFSPLEQEFDRFFTEFFRPRTQDVVKAAKSGYPKLNVAQSKNYYCIQAAVPGVAKEDLSLEIYTAPGEGQRYVRISGSMSFKNQESESAEYYIRELHKSRFSREIALPKHVEGDPKTELKDGILTLLWEHNLYQDAPEPETRKIEIK